MYDDSRRVVTLRSSCTHLNGQNVYKAKYRLYKKNYTCLMFITVRLGFVISFVSIICKSTTLSSSGQHFEINNYFGFSVLLLNEIIHRMTKKAPSAINQSF